MALGFMEEVEKPVMASWFAEVAPAPWKEKMRGVRVLGVYEGGTQMR